MKIIKKNQIVIYVIALMLVVAGYLNYTSTNDFSSALLASSSEEELIATSNIGDAQLVSSNAISEENVNETINELVGNDSGSIETNSNNITEDNSDYFSISKLERDKMYSQMIETYENILNSTNSLETQRQSATDEITKINNIKNSIMICENLIKTKGFKDVVIFVNGNSISIILNDKELNEEKVAQIQNIISREMNATPENIHISSK